MPLSHSRSSPAAALAGSPLYECVTVGDEPDLVLRSSAGPRLVVDAALGELGDGVHTLLAVGGTGTAEIVTDRDFIGVFASAARRTERVGSVCTGAFILAGRRATTHWAYADQLRTRYPDVLVVADEIFVSSDGVFTSAGVTAGIDLALAIVAADHGDELARAVARRLVVDLHRSGGQSQFSERVDPPRLTDAGIASAVAAVQADPGGDHSVATLAERAEMSERNFGRRFRLHTGTTPARWVERVRVDLAREVLETTEVSPAQVAASAGFAGQHTMRQAFQRVLGVSPARYRNTH